MNYHFIFCHGFGYTPAFWQPLKNCFSNQECSFINLGYVSQQQEVSLPLTEKRLIAIGHSLGTLKLAASGYKFFALIGLNSFNNFLGNNKEIFQQRTRELIFLQKSLERFPEKTLKDFYQRCGIKEFYNLCDFSQLNTKTLQQDLIFLKKPQIFPKIPTLILNSLDDPIVPVQLTEDNFSPLPHLQLEYITGCRHNLGFEKAKEIKKKIIDFLDALHHRSH